MPQTPNLKLGFAKDPSPAFRSDLPCQSNTTGRFQGRSITAMVRLRPVLSHHSLSRSKRSYCRTSLGTSVPKSTLMIPISKVSKTLPCSSFLVISTSFPVWCSALGHLSGNQSFQMVLPSIIPIHYVTVRLC